MKHVVTALFLIAGLINLYPLVGVLSADQLVQLYAVEVAGPELEILLRHRAILFGLLGGFMIVAAFKPAWRAPALVGGLISMLGFVVLALSIGSESEAIRRIVIADIVASIVLVLAWVLDRLLKSATQR